MASCVSAFCSTIVVGVVGGSRVGKTAFVKAYADACAAAASGAETLPLRRAASKLQRRLQEQKNSYTPTETAAAHFVVVQMDDFVLNRVQMYDTPGDPRWRSLGWAVVSGAVAKTHVVVVMYNADDVHPHPSIDAARWWLTEIRTLPDGASYDIVLVACSVPPPTPTATTAGEHGHPASDAWSDMASDSDAGLTSHQPPPPDLSTLVEEMMVEFNVRAHHTFVVVAGGCAQESDGDDDASDGDPTPGEQARAALAASLHDLHTEMYGEAFATINGRAEARGNADEVDADAALAYIAHPTLEDLIGDEGVVYHHPSCAKQDAIAERVSAADTVPATEQLGVAILGAPGVGTSSLLDTFASQYAMRESAGSVFGTSFLVRDTPEQRNTPLQLRLHAPAAADVMEDPTRWFTGRRIGAVLYCFHDEASLHYARDLLASCGTPKGAVRVLVRTKCDGNIDTKVLRHAEHLSRDTGVPLTAVSARTRENVDAVFLALATLADRRSVMVCAQASKALADSTRRLDDQILGRGLAPTPLSSLNTLMCDAVRLRALFDELDADGSGCIDATELGGLRRCTDLFGLDDFDRTLRRVQAQTRFGDTNADGKLTFDEFSLLLLQLARN